MPRAVVILPTTTYRAADFVRAAESLGVDLVVASEEAPPIDMGDRYLQIDCSDPESAARQIAELGDRVPLDGIVAADDAGVVVAAIAGSKLGLVANDPTAAASTRDKSMMRSLLRRAEVPQPAFARLDRVEEAIPLARQIGYPLVIKPVARSASQGVLRVNGENELESAIARVRGIVGDEDLMLEEYLPGAEIAVEGLLRDGELAVLAVFDKPDTSPGPTFPETILVTPSRLPPHDLAEAVRVAGLATSGLGLEHGPVHVELRVDGGRVKVIEVAARSIGGLCSRSLSFGLMDTTLETLILRNALMMERPRLRRESRASGVLMIPIEERGTLREVRGLTETRAIPGITGIELTITPGNRVLPVPEGDRYLGFVFARGSHPEEVETALRKAAGAIEPVID